MSTIAPIASEIPAVSKDELIEMGVNTIVMLRDQLVQSQEAVVLIRRELSQARRELAARDAVNADLMADLAQAKKDARQWRDALDAQAGAL